MAVIAGQVTLDSIRLLDVDVDPAVSGGTPANVGDIAIADSGQIYINRDGTATNWRKILQQSGNAAFTAGSILFANSIGDVAEANSQLFWDNVNGRLGLGLTAPVSRLHIDFGTGVSAQTRFTAGSTTGQTATDGLTVGIDASGNGEVRQYENLPLSFFTNNTQQLQIAAGGLGIWTSGIRLGDSADTTNGNVIYDADASVNGSVDFFGRLGGTWVSLTATPSYYAQSSSVITTTSVTPTQLTGSSITPAAGSYVVGFNCETQNTNNGRTHTFMVRVGGTAVAESVRNIFMNQGGNQSMIASTGARVTVNGSQAIDIAWDVSANTGSVIAYTMHVTKVQAL